MADNAKLGVSLVVSTNSDYSEPHTQPKIDTDEFTPLDTLHSRITATTTATDSDISLGNYTTIKYLIVKNLSTTVAVTVAFDNAANNTPSIVVPAKGFFICPDVDVGTVVSFTSATVAGAQVDMYLLVTA